MEFDDEWAAIAWMCRNQLGRRNITESQRDYLLMQEYEAQSKTHGGDRGNQYTKVPSGTKGHLAKPENGTQKPSERRTSPFQAADTLPNYHSTRGRHRGLKWPTGDFSKHYVTGQQKEQKSLRF